MFTTGKDAMMADVSAQLYHRAIAVMRGAETCGGFISLSDAESYAIEYWPLEQYKLKLAPPEREFARHVVLVTGAAGGIGSATCRRLAQDGAHIVATDINLAGVEQLAAYLNQQFGAGRAVAVKMDVTNEESARAAFEQAALAFGGIDVIVNNAGLASSAELLVEVGCQVFCACQIDVSGDNMCPILRHAPADGRADASCRTRHQHHVPRELALWWCQLELVLLQRPIFDRVTLGVTQ